MEALKVQEKRCLNIAHGNIKTVNWRTLQLLHLDDRRTTHQWHFTLIFNYKSSKKNLHKVELILSYFDVFFILYKFP